MNPESLANQAETLLDNAEGTTGNNDGSGAESATDTGKTRTDGQTDSGANSDSARGDGEGQPQGGPEGNSGGDSKDPSDDSGQNGSDSSGYLADEGDDESEPEPPPKDTEPTNLSPDLQYVVEHLPALSVRGKDGKTYSVKAAGQLPDDFEFATKRDELLFSQAIAGQELKAQQLQTQYFQEQQNKAAQEFSDKENRDIRRDIGSLQREGRLERFKYAPDDRRFNDDPAVKEAQKVIDFMNERNSEYLDMANKGGVLYHLSFRDAYRLMQSETSSKPPTRQQQEDRERKQVTRQTAGATSGTPSSAPKSRSYGYVGDLKDMVDILGFE
jgi:hypothetical protein